MNTDQWAGVALLIAGIITLSLGVLARLADGDESIDPALDRVVYISAGACIVVGLYFAIGG